MWERVVRIVRSGSFRDQRELKIETAQAHLLSRRVRFLSMPHILGNTEFFLSYSDVAREARERLLDERLDLRGDRATLHAGDSENLPRLDLQNGLRPPRFCNANSLSAKLRILGEFHPDQSNHVSFALNIRQCEPIDEGYEGLRPLS